MNNSNLHKSIESERINLHVDFKANKKAWLLNISAILLFSVIFTLFPKPLIDWQNSLPDAGDTLIAMSIIKWDQRCIVNPFLHCSDLPIFYPAKGALYFTEHMYGIAAVNSVYRALGFDINSAFNLTIIFFIFANFIVSWILFKWKWALGYIPSFIWSGFVFGPAIYT